MLIKHRGFEPQVDSSVFVAPNATLVGKVSIGPKSRVMYGAVIHSGAIVAVGSFVHANTVVPSEFFVPPNTIAIGDPVRIFSPEEKDALVDAIRSIGFTKITFDVDPKEIDRLSVMKKATEVRSNEFESHFDDDVL